MMKNGFASRLHRAVATGSIAATALVIAASAGCGGAPPSNNGTTENGSNVVGAKSFNGTLSGTVAGAASTRESFDSEGGGGAQQALPSIENADAAVVQFSDVEGSPLLDPQGDGIAAVSVATDGSFTAEGLPVGVDFVVDIDLEGDGTSDLSQVVQIPADETGQSGQLKDVVVDPLTTLIVAKLRTIFEDQGVDTSRLDVSPTAIVRRVVDAFVHLFEESGIDERITVDDLRALSPQELDGLFEKLLPPAVRAGVETVRGNLALSGADKVETVVKGAAEVFLQAGFPIVDQPGGIDLSFLADLPDVEVRTIDDVRRTDDRVIETAQFEGINLDGTPLADLAGNSAIGDLLGSGTIGDLLGDGTISDLLNGGQLPGSLPDTVFAPPAGDSPVVYVSTVTEPDLNFIALDESDPNPGAHLPFINERLLARIARLRLEHRTITLRNLHRLLTDPDLGFGARLAYTLPGFRDDRRTPLVFETADGRGIVRDVKRVIAELLQAGVVDPNASFDDLAGRTDLIRQKMRELLSGTLAPSVRRLFGPILSERIESADQLFSFIRKARAHLPFNRSGPSTFYVLANGDRFNPDAGAVSAVTVDIQFDEGDHPLVVSLSADGTGAYYLEFTRRTESDGIVGILVRETGRRLHGPRGAPVRIDMRNGDLFEPVGDVAFADFVSDSGTFWPGVAISVGERDFRLDAENATAGGPNMQLFVLSTEPGRSGDPVRVDFDVTADTFTFNPTSGRFYLAFLPNTQRDGMFGLYDVDRNFMLGVNDLSVDRVIEVPEPVDGEPLIPPPDGTRPPDLSPAPTDGTLPPDASLTPPDGTTPPEAVVQQVLPGDTRSPNGDLTAGEPDVAPSLQPAKVNPTQVVGLTIEPEFFQQVFGIEVANPRFDRDANPFFDDVNGNGVEDAGEPTLDHRPTLFNPQDWRSTDVARYYRRAGGASVIVDEVNFDSDQPQTTGGEALVPRDLLPRLNALRFGRPNSAINLLTTFLPPEFFDGTHAINADTKVGIFQAIAMINLVMSQTLNVEAIVDIDRDGPLPPKRMLVEAQLFVPPIGDPFVLLVDGFDQLSAAQTPQ